MVGGVLALALAAATPGAGWPAPSLAHLDWLRRDVPRAGGGTLATWQIYATPERPGDRRGPYRFVGDEDEGVGCVDDVARAAIVYARAFARTGDAHAADQARAALAFVAAQDAGGGTYFNFVWADGTPNRAGPTSKPGLNWWTARALWALAEGAAAFRRSDPAYADALRARAGRTVDALARDLARRDGTTWRWGRGPGSVAAPGWFMGEAPDVTAVAVIALAALHRDRPEPRLARLIGRYGAAIAAWAPAPAGADLAGAHLPGLGPAHWHAYGSHMLHALAAGGAAIGSRALIDAARREATTFTPHLLIGGGPIAGYVPAPLRHPQIAYGVAAQALGLLALADATGEARHATLAGLFAAWLTGANDAASPMFDPATGRAFDGIDAKGPNADAGAESTIEALLALQAVGTRPALAPLARAREVARRAPAFLEAEAAPGVLRVAGPDLSGGHAALLAAGETLVLGPVGGPTASGPALPQGPCRLTPVAWRAKHVPGERARLRVMAVPGPGEPVARRRPDLRPLAWPPAGAPWPAGEALAAPREAYHVGPATRVAIRLEPGARQAVRLDGVIVQPEVEWRTFTTGTGLVAVVANRTPDARQARVPGLARPVALPPWGTAVLSIPAAGGHTP